MINNDKNIKLCINWVEIIIMGQLQKRLKTMRAKKKKKKPLN